MTDKKYLERRTKARFAISLLCGIKEIDCTIIEIVEDMVHVMKAEEDVPVRAIEALCGLANHVRWCADDIMEWRQERGLPTDLDEDQDGEVFQYPVPVAARAKPVRRRKARARPSARSRLERAADAALEAVDPSNT